MYACVCIRAKLRARHRIHLDEDGRLASSRVPPVAVAVSRGRLTENPGSGFGVRDSAFRLKDLRCEDLHTREPDHDSDPCQSRKVLKGASMRLLRGRSG